MEEIWKDIKGYEEIYQVSNFGKIKSIIKNKIMKPWINNKGYQMIALWKNKEKHKYLIHRIVADNFLDIIIDKPFCDHIDGNPLNNKVTNLRWCTHKENCNFEIAIERKKDKQKEIHSRAEWRMKQSASKKIAMNKPEVKAKLKKSQAIAHANPIWIDKQRKRSSVNKPVIQYDKNFSYIEEYISISDASRETGIDGCSIIKCCKGVAYTAGGYKWKYKTDVLCQD